MLHHIGLFIDCDAKQIEQAFSHTASQPVYQPATPKLFFWFICQVFKKFGNSF
jgi:hypothetical protein